jgi:hypothetical protein
LWGLQKAKPKKEDDFNWRCDDADEEPEPVLPGTTWRKEIDLESQAERLNHGPHHW